MRTFFPSALSLCFTISSVSQLVLGFGFAPLSLSGYTRKLGFDPRPRPRPLQSTPEPVELSNDEISRYSRHLVLSDVGMKGQKALKNSSVLVIGAGGLGSPCLMYLAAAGVGNIGIVVSGKWNDEVTIILYGTFHVSHVSALMFYVLFKPTRQ